MKPVWNQQAVQKGMLFDWNEDDILTDYGPYIKEHMPYALEKNANLSGGTTYGYGFDVAVDPSARGDIMYTWDVRWDLYKELGYPEIKNLDDMVEVLAQMKMEKQPMAYPCLMTGMVIW